MLGENLFSQHAEAATADFIQPHEGSTENCKPPKNTGMLMPNEADMTCGVKQSSMYIHSTQRAAFTLNIQHSFLALLYFPPTPEANISHHILPFVHQPVASFDIWILR